MIGNITTFPAHILARFYVFSSNLRSQTFRNLHKSFSLAILCITSILHFLAYYCLTNTISSHNIHHKLTNTSHSKETKYPTKVTRNVCSSSYPLTTLFSMSAKSSHWNHVDGSVVKSDAIQSSFRQRISLYLTIIYHVSLFLSSVFTEKLAFFKKYIHFVKRFLVFE